MKNCHLSAGSAAAFTDVRIWGDGKLASAYAREKTIGTLSPCRHELTLNLQATDHPAFATEARMITARRVIDA